MNSLMQSSETKRLLTQLVHYWGEISALTSTWMKWQQWGCARMGFECRSFHACFSLENGANKAGLLHSTPAGFVGVSM